MTGSPTTQPPEGLPEPVASDLAGLSPDELRDAVVYAQELLQSHGSAEFPVDPGPDDDDVLRVREHERYTEVVKQHRCTEGCDDCPHGPYLYHVTEESLPDGTHETHWSFIGRVNVDDD